MGSTVEEPVTTAEEALNAYAPSMIRIGFVLRCRRIADHAALDG
jgi:hypothetical protein